MQHKPFALDLGTTKFCIATNTIKSDKTMQMETVSVLAKGMHRGMLANFSEAKSALTQLIEIAENEFNYDISKVSVGIAGSHLQSYSIEKTTDINNEEVSSQVLKKIDASIIEHNTNQNREIIHTIPVNYSIDDRVLLNPIGFSGKTIKGNYFLIEANKYYLKDVIKLCNECGLEVDRLVAEPIASSMVSLNSDLKKIGVVVADIGGGTTDGVIFINNQPVKIFTINIGGELMTNDLSIGLGLSKIEAEKIKILWGLKYNEQDKNQIEMRNAINQIIKIDSRQVFDILAPRIRELADYIFKEIKSFRSHLGAGIVLTGGGSEVLGIAPYLNHILKINVQKQKPTLGFVSNQDIASKFATAAGLLKIALEEEKKAHKPMRFLKYFSPFINWLKEFS